MSALSLQQTFLAAHIGTQERQEWADFILLQESKREVEDKRKRLRRQGSMLKTMYCATITASRLVSAVR